MKIKIKLFLTLLLYFNIINSLDINNNKDNNNNKDKDNNNFIIEEFNKLNDEECISYIQDDNFISLNLPDLMSIALNKGLWKCAKDMTRIASQDNIDLRSVFDLGTRIIQKEISLLKSAIESNLPMSTINPAFQWAQSVSDVFLNIKFAHKLDAPATLNVEAQNVTINPQSLTLRASDGRKLFSLDLEFLKEIIPEESSWSMASVGRMTINLKKKDNPSKWARLTRGRKKPSNLHYWFEIHEKHSAELEKLNEDEDDDEDEKDSKKTSSTTSTSPTTPNNNEKKKSKKDQRAEKIADSEYEKEKTRINQWLKTQLNEIENRGREKKREIDEESRNKKNLIDEETEKEKVKIRNEHTEMIRVAEENNRNNNNNNNNNNVKNEL